MDALERKRWHEKLDEHLNRECYQTEHDMTPEPLRALVIYSETVYGAVADIRGEGRHGSAPGSEQWVREALPHRLRKLLRRHDR